MSDDHFRREANTTHSRSRPLFCQSNAHNLILLKEKFISHLQCLIPTET